MGHYDLVNNMEAPLDETTNLWMSGLTIASFIGTALWGWLVFFMKRELSRIDDLEKSHSNHRMEVVGNYVTKVEFSNSTSRLEKRFDDGVDKLDRKLDTLFMKLDRKQDRP